VRFACKLVALALALCPIVVGAQLPERQNRELFSLTQPKLHAGKGTVPASNQPFMVNRVLLLSIDGLHAVDLAECVQENSCPTLARLSSTGVTYTNASTSRPSDSFPGLTAQITGGLPPTTGIWYDVTFNHALFSPGSNCTGPAGTQVPFDESIDFDNTQLDGGASSHGGAAIDATTLPRDPLHGCAAVYPHSYLRVNTIFEVARAAGLHTAWSDKHPAYDLANGPSGTGVDDLYNPEIASLVPAGTCNSDGTASWTDSICAVETYDGFKVAAILHEIDGLDHTGTVATGIPAIFGMNFQAVSVAQKLHSDPQFGQGGYSYVGGVIRPGAGLLNAIGFVDSSVGRMVDELSKNGLLSDTLIIVSAKHGQSPIDVSKRVGIDPQGDGTPGSIFGQIIGSAYAFDLADDGVLMWLSDQSQTANAVAKLATPANQAALGTQEILSGNLLTQTFDDPLLDPRTPDIILKTNTGVIFTGGSKIAEHGGLNEDDVHVALLVSNPNFSSKVIRAPIQTTQIAPTIVQSLGLDPENLKAVVIEKTAVLPGLFLEPSAHIGQLVR